MRGPQPPDSVQSRTWTFTDQNVARLDMFWKSIAVKHLWIGCETAPTTGTKHLQGVVVWLRPYRMSQLKKLVPGAHWEAAKMIDAENYTMKENLVLERHMSEEEERRTRAERQWTGKDFREAVCRDIDDGVCNRCLFQRYPGYMFAQAERVFRWRFYKRYGRLPPWRSEHWCQNCGREVMCTNVGKSHVFTCSACAIRVCPTDHATEDNE